MVSLRLLTPGPGLQARSSPKNWLKYDRLAQEAGLVTCSASPYHFRLGSLLILFSVGRWLESMVFG